MLLTAPTIVGAAGTGLDLPGGERQLASRNTALGSYALPLSTYTAEGIRDEVFEGRILRRTWQIPGDATSLQVLAPLRAQLQGQGFLIAFECQARECGGFDFRFAIEVVPAPDMAVDLSDFHFLSATHPDGRIASLLISRSGDATYVQLIEGLDKGQDPLSVGEASEGPVTEPEPGLAETLLADGRVVLKGVIFNSGEARLGQNAIASTEALAQFLTDHPERNVLIVGHTDTEGTLAENVEISLQRAKAVKDRLTSVPGIDGARIDVAGAGFMSPIANNETALGRAKNRRVEAVLIPED